MRLPTTEKVFVILQQGIAVLFSFFILDFVFSQSNTPVSRIDSISNLTKADKEDTLKLLHLDDLGWELIYQNPDTAIIVGQQALELATKLMNSDPAIKKSAENGLANAFNLLGNCYYQKGDYPVSLSYHFQALDMKNKLGDKKKIAASLNNIAIVYNRQGEYTKALEYNFKALQIKEEIGDKKGISFSLGNIGSVYHYQGEFKKSLEYHFKALKINEELGNKNSIGYNLSNIGLNYANLHEYEKALEYYFKALKMNEELGNKNNIASILGSIGEVYDLQGEYDKALENEFKAFDIYEEFGDKHGIAYTLGSIGKVYLKQKKYQEAEATLLKSLRVSTEIGALDIIRDCHQNLSEVYAQTKRYQLAYEHYVQFSAARDSLFNEDKSKEIGRLEMKHEIEMAEMERERKAVEELKIKTQKIERRNLLEYSGMVIGLIIIGLIVAILGIVKVKPWVAEGITFFVFLLFFEFLLVLLDPYLDKFTNGEPAYKLFMNAAVAICIFPIHAFFEKMLKKRLMKRR